MVRGYFWCASEMPAAKQVGFRMKQLIVNVEYQAGRLAGVFITPFRLAGLPVRMPSDTAVNHHG
jgi:hypothetical protein